MPKDFRRRWKRSELLPALSLLVTRISAEQERQGLNDQALAYAADMHPKTWARYLNGQIPATAHQEQAVERILRLADVVGIPRAESESMIPPPVPISPVPLGQNTAPSAVAQLTEAIRSNGERLDALAAKLDTLLALLGESRR